VTPGGPHCGCVKAHSPQPVVLERHHIWPKGHGGPSVPGNYVWLCPTAHGNVHEYLDYMLKTGGMHPSDWRRYNTTCRAVAEQGYRRIEAQALVD
jgi:hypothetical protein